MAALCACFDCNVVSVQLSLPSAEAAALERSLLADSAFLCEQSIMDYSLLVGVQKQVTRAVPPVPLCVAGRRAHSSRALVAVR